MRRRKRLDGLKRSGRRRLTKFRSFGQDEEDLILKLHALLGRRWSLIAGRLPGRMENEVKDYWYSHLIDQNNHRPNRTLLAHHDQHCRREDDHNVKCDDDNDGVLSDATSCLVEVEESDNNNYSNLDLNLQLAVGSSSSSSSSSWGAADQELLRPSSGPSAAWI